MSNKEKLGTKRDIRYDIIRAMATLMIVVYHFEVEVDSKDKVFMPRNISCWRGADWGGIAVFLFFMLSGAAHALKHSEDFDIKKYYKSRLMGILPMFYLTYILAAIVELIIGGDAFSRGTSPWKIIFTVFVCDGYFPGLGDTFYLVGEWFTTVILFIYLIFPAVRIAIKKQPIIYFAALAALDVFFYFDLWNPLGIVFGGNCFPALTVFSLGYIWKKLGRIPQIIITAIATAIGGALTLLNFSSPITSITLAIGAWGIILWLTGLLPETPNNIRRALSVVAAYSYAVYLTHHFIIRKIVALSINGYLMIVSVMILTAATSYMVFNLNKLITNRK